jgi:hypothetical protein
MRLNLVLAAAVLFAALPAMAQTQSPRGEYFTGPSGPNQYAVVFRGDTRMDRRSVAERAMLRAAELTLEKGDQWFVVTSSATQRVDLRTATPLAELDRQTGAINDTSIGAGGSGAGPTDSGHAATFGVDPGAVGLGTQVDPRLLERRRPRAAYQTVLIIRTGRGRELQVDDASRPVDVYDAAAIAQSLRARVQQQ